MKSQVSKVVFMASAFATIMSLGARAQAQMQTASGPNSAGPRSITELAVLSNILIHHYDCTVDLLLSPASINREMNFTVGPLLKGETGPIQTLQLQSDKLIASANGQMLSLEWTRMGHSVANVKTMIIDSPNRSYNLIAVDPSNSDQQAQIVCNGVTFAQASQQNVIKNTAPDAIQNTAVAK